MARTLPSKQFRRLCVSPHILPLVRCPHTQTSAIMLPIIYSSFHFLHPELCSTQAHLEYALSIPTIISLVLHGSIVISSFLTHVLMEDAVGYLWRSCKWHHLAVFFVTVRKPLAR